jgi:hypothetical protein
VDFGVDRRARSRKAKGGLRSLFGKAPSGREVGERVARLVKRIFKGDVDEAGWKNDRFVAALALHPAAPRCKVIVETDADLVVRGSTAAIGPGYHAMILGKLAPLLDELDYAWVDDDGDIPAAMTAWLAGRLREGPVRLGVPEHRAFKLDAPVLTLMGPRDAAWRDAVIDDPARAADAFPWWRTGPGTRERSHALVEMWLDVPWREPFDPGELETMERVDANLRAAWRADPELELPFPEWALILEWLGVDDEVVPRVRERADGPATIGYRRYDMDVELSGGWSMTLPGSFITTWDEDDARFVATDGQRVVEFTSLTANGADDSDKLLAVAPEHHPVIARFAEDARRGRAEASIENNVRIVHGLMTSAPHVAILTIKNGDEAWALEMWRSLRVT